MLRALPVLPVACVSCSPAAAWPAPSSTRASRPRSATRPSPAAPRRGGRRLLLGFETLSEDDPAARPTRSAALRHQPVRDQPGRPRCRRAARRRVRRRAEPGLQGQPRPVEPELASCGGSQDAFLEILGAATTCRTCSPSRRDRAAGPGQTDATVGRQYAAGQQGSRPGSPTTTSRSTPVRRRPRRQPARSTPTCRTRSGDRQGRAAARADPGYASRCPPPALPTEP